MHSPVVLLYHRVGIDEIDSQLLAVSPANFESQLNALSEMRRVVPLDQLISDASSGYFMPDTVCLTFDDGYLDNLTNALPLLEKFHLHATVFVASGMIGSKHEFWWDAMERIFLTCAPLPEFLKLNGHGKLHQLDMCSPESRLYAYEELCKYLRSISADDAYAFVESLYRWAGQQNVARPTHLAVAHSDLIKLASSPYIEIGAHGVSHGVLSLMTEDEQRHEIRQSKYTLENIIKRQVRFFSYPYGTQASFNNVTKKILEEEGFYAGIANIQGELRNSLDRYSIPRRLVRNWPDEKFRSWMSNEDRETLEMETSDQRMSSLISYQYRTTYGEPAYVS